MQIIKNGNHVLETETFQTNDAEMYIASDNGGETWSLLYATTGEHYDYGNPRFTGAFVDVLANAERFLAAKVAVGAL